MDELLSGNGRRTMHEACTVGSAPHMSRPPWSAKREPASHMRAGVAPALYWFGC
jgi:hypothetical protein